MEDKLRLLLEKCNLNFSEYTWMDTCKLTRIRVSKKDDCSTFIIESDNPWPLNIYLQLLEGLNKVFCDYQKNVLIIKVNDINYYQTKDMFNEVLLLVKDTKHTYQIFENRELGIDGNNLIVNIYNKAELMKFNKIKDEMQGIYQNLGFNDLKIKTFYEEKQQSTKKEFVVTPKTLKKQVNFEYVLGKKISKKPILIKEIHADSGEVVIMGKLFDFELRDTRRQDLKILMAKFSDSSDSIACKAFINDSQVADHVKNTLALNNYYLVKGKVEKDSYSGEVMITMYDINHAVVEERMDNAVVKRVELHAHTKMSQMDGLCDPAELIKLAKKWGHKAIAITDHNSVQSFPQAYYNAKDIKVIYGVELNMVDDLKTLVTRATDADLLSSTYVIFDVETTGFNPGSGDSIIEIGAVKVKDGEIIEEFSELIDPKVPLNQTIIDITGITDEMLKGKPSEEEVIKNFLNFIEGAVLIAHNAKFDMSFLDMAITKYKFLKINNPVIDTLELSRKLYPEHNRHSLSHLVKRFNVEFEEDSHHRALYDAIATSKIFNLMVKDLLAKAINKISDINHLVGTDEVHKSNDVFHIILLAKNQEGLKNLFKLVSLANTKYLYKTPRILRSLINKYRDGLLVGSSCYAGEVFMEALRKSEEELRTIMGFYDYIEIQPPAMYHHMLQTGDFANEEAMLGVINKIITTADSAMKDVVVTGDVHHLHPEDKIYREVIVNQKVPGGGFHPLNRKNIKDIPSAHFRTTDEMLSDFSFLDQKLAKKIVIDNPNKIADMIDTLQIIKDRLYQPKVENSAEEVKRLVNEKVHQLYGDKLPIIVNERVEEELNSIIKHGFDGIYLIAEKLVKKSNEDGYLVGSRGSVGSSFVATMMGITEVNPLPPHYLCTKCKTSIFEENDQAFGTTYSSGYDLPDRKCSCGEMMQKEGQDMPFATFLGIKGDKVPDIDLNFSGDYQAKAHDYTKVLFGEENVFRAGTIGTVASKTAYGFAKGYAEDKGLNLRNAEIERLAKGCEGVKRTTGQHPGGIIVIPDYMNVFDFTPYQYPADDIKSRWYTTHFDFHAIHDNVLKLDILGHDDPTVLKMLQDLSGIDIKSLPFDDAKVISLLKSPEALGVSSEAIMCETGTLGLPELGTKFVIQMLVDTKPSTFGELVKISGLSHGTDVWIGNAKELIDNNICPFKDVIGCRDDIMVYLSYNGLSKQDAFKIMEFVRKGLPSKDPAGWLTYKEQMEQAGIADWYIESCRRIKYMFPKAHATAYVMMALRIAWFKVYRPLEYYASLFSVRSNDFDIDTMIAGYDAIKDKITYLQSKGYEITKKETDVLDVLINALEMTARGFTFANINLEKSDSHNFVIEGNTLIPPFRTVEGLGGIVAENIKKVRSTKTFVSIEDFQKNCKVSKTVVDTLKTMGVLDGLPESGQLSLFDL